MKAFRFLCLSLAALDTFRIRSVDVSRLLEVHLVVDLVPPLGLVLGKTDLCLDLLDKASRSTREQTTKRETTSLSKKYQLK